MGNHAASPPPASTSSAARRTHSLHHLALGSLAHGASDSCASQSKTFQSECCERSSRTHLRLRLRLRLRDLIDLPDPPPDDGTARALRHRYDDGAGIPGVVGVGAVPGALGGARSFPCKKQGMQMKAGASGNFGSTAKTAVPSSQTGHRTKAATRLQTCSGRESSG